MAQRKGEPTHGMKTRSKSQITDNEVKAEAGQQAATVPPKTTIKRHRDGRLNLTKTPKHLVAKAQRNADESLLLPLPPEIRNRIWKFAMKVDCVQVWATNCLVDQSNNQKGGAIALDAYEKPIFKHRTQQGYHCCPLRDRSAFHLPEVCRQIYAETSTLAYSINTFLLNQASFTQKRNWAKSFMIGQRDAISNIEIDENICWVLGCLPLIRNLGRKGLRNLKKCHVPHHSLEAYIKLYYRGSLVPSVLVQNIQQKAIKELGDKLILTFGSEVINDKLSA